ncbi:protein FAM81A-like [Haliotis rufescens]|uniref:protein FAM81A-like n=1 Tax=Haliotis rufescens TaxID=6454 RepID=UPI001EAFF6E4|nr:protein FAM81A-like [Haliotis rufescens]XP_046373677.1 protein FAM81A-like [Haliotis rufescens]XP_046373679.1 protein FAM81A-like [Haliotis rufescens]
MSLTTTKRRLPYIRAPYDTNQEYTAISVGGMASPRTMQALPQIVDEQQYMQQPVQVMQPAVQVMQPAQAVQSVPTEIVRYDNSPSHHHLDMLEERLAQQERNTQGLIERAFKIKEDVIESLNFSQGTWQDEKNARGHLQDHIRNITSVVNRLNHDIAVLEENIKARDSAALGTNNAVKSIEMHHVTSLSDLRGRIVRCDTAIAKLSVDMRTSFDSIRVLSGQQQELQSRLMERMHGIESQLVSMTNAMEKVTGESRIKFQHLEGDTNNNLSMLDSKTRQMIEDLKNTITSVAASAEGERERMEQRIISLIEKAGGTRDLMIEKIDKKIDDNMYMLEVRIQKLEDALMEDRSHYTDLQSHIESKLLARIEADIRRLSEELAKLKRECREGFSTVHESISNMKTVMEGRRKLLEDQLRKELSQIRKMVVLV